MATEEGRDEREPVLARRSPFSPATKLCPRCLSPLATSNKDLLGIIPAEYYCRKCKYSGSVYLEGPVKGDK
ncbi:MAG: hypothetical protein JRN21_04190 [Nitrososphaerota archaeon]|nr:hypothetical protein [Nitrososphaerota archaeon]